MRLGVVSIVLVGFGIGLCPIVSAQDAKSSPAGVRLVDGRVEFGPLGADVLKPLSELKPDDPLWPSLLSVRVVSDLSEDETPVLQGQYEIAGDKIRFLPKHALRPGQKYLVLFDAARATGDPEAKPVRLTLSLPARDVAPSTTVERIYPTADELPENHLRFYIHFSAPMSQGEAYDRISLIGEDGEIVESPFLELAEEMWDPSRKRLTLLIHPGRIKRGLKPREEAGPVLVAGKKYALVIDQAWLDGEGAPLVRGSHKVFRVGPAEDQPLDQSQWKVTSPKAGSREPLVVRFPMPLDRALLERLVWVAGADGQRRTGTVLIDDKERRWRFVPSEPWQAGGYAVTVDTALEDTCGNRIGRAFDLDVFEQVEKKVVQETITVPFEVQ